MMPAPIPGDAPRVNQSVPVLGQSTSTDSYWPVRVWLAAPSIVSAPVLEIITVLALESIFLILYQIPRLAAAIAGSVKV
jgi:hypothetical protein